MLVGGASRRFGRDKLLEPHKGSMGGEFLVDQPVLALRAVFGPIVWLVGDCSSAVARRGDQHAPDGYPGIGPLGGILTGLERLAADILVLPGDAPAITSSDVRALSDHARRMPEADAVLARTTDLEPCIAVYRQTAVPAMRAAISAGRFAVRAALDQMLVSTLALSADAARNVNRPEDLRDHA